MGNFNLSLKSFFIAFSIFVCFSFSHSLKAQYTFSAFKGSFVPLTDGKPVNSIQKYSSMSGTIDLGFTFKFNGQPYSKIKASASGFITFRKSSNWNEMDSTIIAPLGYNALSGEKGNASYSTEGTAPNRVFTFEWLNWKWDWDSQQPCISFQVKLYETTNRIEFVYRQEAGIPNNPIGRIGLAFQYAGKNLFLSDVSENPIVYSNSQYYIYQRPATGQVYRFSEVSKPEPDGHVTSFSNLEPGSVSLKWKDATGTDKPERYLILVSDKGFEKIKTPVDGEEFAQDLDLKNGDAAVYVDYGKQYFIGWVDSSTNKTYYFKIFPVNNYFANADFKNEDEVPQLQVNTTYYRPPLTEVVNAGLTGVSGSTQAWGDYDNDSDLDLIIGGSTGRNQIVELYRNNAGTFVKTSAKFDVEFAYDITWSDFDNDYDLDVLILSSGVSKIFENDGKGSFSEKVNLPEVFSGRARWADFDNNGYSDLLITGLGGTKIFKNDGKGGFEIQSTNLPTVSNLGSVVCGDYDNDGDPDFILAGLNGNIAICRVFKNNGNFGFEEQTGIQLPGIFDGAVEWADMDNDGDLDIVLSGDGPLVVTKIFTNNGNNSFAEIDGDPFKALYMSSFAIGDYNNDGYRDLIISGSSYGADYQTLLYRNNGNNSFSLHEFPKLPGAQSGSLAWGDYDNDSDLDLFICGNGESGKFSTIFRNNSIEPNQKPDIKTLNMSVSQDGRNVVFSWQKPADDKTAPEGLSYNLVVIGASKAPYDNLSLFSRDGAIQFNRSGYRLNNLPFGDYSYKLQVIDASMAVSEYTGNFVISDLAMIDMDVSTAQFTNTSADIQYSFNSTDGVNGTWVNCQQNRTEANFIPGGFDVWIRQGSNPSNKLKMAYVAPQLGAPNFTINFQLENTSENLPETTEYSIIPNMKTGVSSGTGAPVSLMPGSLVYFRHKGSKHILPSAIQTLVVPVRPASPAISTDFRAEKTSQPISESMEYSSSISMGSAVSGNNQPLAIVPGQTIYFRKKATATAFSSEIQILSVPPRPKASNFSLNFGKETTLENISNEFEYSYSPSMSSAISGNGQAVTIAPGQNLYIYRKANAETFKSEIQDLVIPNRPPAPSGLVIDDVDNSFNWDFVPGVSFPDYEYSVDSGATWQVCNSKPVNIGNINVGKGRLMLRLMATENSFKGESASSGQAFTVNTSIQTLGEAGIKLYPNPVAETLCLNNLPENATISVLNSKGNLVIQKKAGSSEIIIPVPQLARGLFLVIVTTPKGQYQSKFLKQ